MQGIGSLGEVLLFGCAAKGGPSAGQNSKGCSRPSPDVFATPEGLLPPRASDHHIQLKPGSVPIIVRPYQYPGRVEINSQKDRPSWESFELISNQFPEFHLEDKVKVQQAAGWLVIAGWSVIWQAYKRGKTKRVEGENWVVREETGLPTPDDLFEIYAICTLFLL